MADESEKSDELLEGSESGPIVDRPPKLRADISVLTIDPHRRKSVATAIPEKITVRQYGDVKSFTEALSDSVAVALISIRLPEESLQTATLRTIQDTNYTRIGLLADDREQAFDTGVPHDEMFYKSSDRQTFQNRVKRLYVRAYYEAALQRYYKLNLATQNRRAKLEDDEVDDDEQLQKLTASTELMETHLQRFRQYLQPGDIESIRGRSERIEQMVTALLEGNDPTVVGLPRRCPDCGLAWDEWHDSERKSGHEKIGADTWRCTGCGTVIGGNDPDNYRVS